MKRNRKILFGTGSGVILAALLLGAWAYTEFYGGPARFDASFYAVQQSNQDAPFSYALYAATLRKYVDEKGMVSYAELKTDPEDLDAFCRAMGHLDPQEYGAWDDHAKITFWINAYNALTLRVIIEHYPIKAGVLRAIRFPKNSIRQIPGVWDKLQFLVMHKKTTLNGIEHSVLRAEFNEPRIHVALVCAAMGCPPLRNEPYLPDKLNDQLDNQAKKFLSSPAKFRIDRSAGKVYLSSIFKWFGADFVKTYGTDEGFAGHGQSERAVLNFISQYLQQEDAPEYLRSGNYRIDYLEYDWSLNERSRGVEQDHTTKAEPKASR